MYNIYIYGLYTAPKFPNPFLSIEGLFCHFTIYFSNKLCHHQVFCSQRREKLREKYLNKAYIHPRLANRTVQLMYSTKHTATEILSNAANSILTLLLFYTFSIIHMNYYTFLASFLLSIFVNYKIC